jgi:hypothetical protein
LLPALLFYVGVVFEHKIERHGERVDSKDYWGSADWELASSVYMALGCLAYLEWPSVYYISCRLNDIHLYRVTGKPIGRTFRSIE